MVEESIWQFAKINHKKKRPNYSDMYSKAFVSVFKRNVSEKSFLGLG